MTASISVKEVDTIIFACEAGVGSSLMSVNSLKKLLKKANVKVNVVNKAARSIPQDAKVVVVHRGLFEVARKQAPQAVILAFQHFLNDPVFDGIVKSFVDGTCLLQTWSPPT